MAKDSEGIGESMGWAGRRRCTYLTTPASETPVCIHLSVFLLSFSGMCCVFERVVCVAGERDEEEELAKSASPRLLYISTHPLKIISPSHPDRDRSSVRGYPDAHLHRPDPISLSLRISGRSPVSSLPFLANSALHEQTAPNTKSRFVSHRQTAHRDLSGCCPPGQVAAWKQPIPAVPLLLELCLSCSIFLSFCFSLGYFCS